MYDITTNKSYDIASYGFGKKIEQHGFEILSCVSAREGKKIFGNDPDAFTNIFLTNDDETAFLYPDLVRNFWNKYFIHAANELCIWCRCCSCKFWLWNNYVI